MRHRSTPINVISMTVDDHARRQAVKFVEDLERIAEELVKNLEDVRLHPAKRPGRLSELHTVRDHIKRLQDVYRL